jgi:hypothetical protein
MTKVALKLYILKDVSGATVKDASGSPLYFSDKMMAKANRAVGQHVSYGPDHKKSISKKGN